MPGEMIQSGRSGARLALVLLCVFAASAMTAQNKLSPQERARLDAARRAAELKAAQTTTIAPLRPRMPNLLWLEGNEVQALLRKQLHRLARVAGKEGVVIAQMPAPDADVPLEGVIAIQLGLPKLSITGSNLNPRADEQVMFTLAFNPPPANPAKVEYHFVWDDGTPEVMTGEPSTTRQFPVPGVHGVTAYAVINGRWTTGRTVTRVVVAAIPLVKIPQLLWLERGDADSLLAPLKLNVSVTGDGIVLGQSLPPGSEVKPGSPLTLTLGLPKLTLSASTTTLGVNDAVTFNLAFDPPPPAPPKVTYRIPWPDGTPETSTDQPAVTHPFATAGDFTVTATALINGTRTVESNPVSLTVAPLPPVPNMPQLLWLERSEADSRLQALKLGANVAGQSGIVIGQNPAAGSHVPPGSVITLTLGVPRLSLSTPAANTRVNDEVTFNAAFDPPPPAPAKVAYRFQWRDGTSDTAGDQAVAAHRFSAAGTYPVVAAAVINDRWTVDSALVNVSVAALPPTIPWKTILLVAAALAVLIVGTLLVRGRTSKTTAPSPQLPPAVTLRSGLGSTTTHEIEHSGPITDGLSVHLRSGVRSTVAVEGGVDA
jgi:beta-lactam-binding protein with PASTA domain